MTRIHSVVVEIFRAATGIAFRSDEAYVALAWTAEPKISPTNR